MTKTAAIILNHNLPEWTDRLYKSLKPYEGEDYDLLVFDNGSTEENTSEFTTFKSDENLFFGGGFNAGMQVVIESDGYDSMLFLNNDLTVHPYTYVKTLRDAMFTPPGKLLIDSGPTGTIKADIVSPCFYNVEPEGQCHWKTMHNWGSKYPRQVPFIDFQCPLISKRLIKEIDLIDADLMYGWGIDALFAIHCKDKGYKMEVLDYVSILHHNSVTVKSGVAGLSMADYCKKAELGQFEFFAKSNLIKKWTDVRKAGESYKHS